MPPEKIVARRAMPRHVATVVVFVLGVLPSLTAAGGVQSRAAAGALRRSHRLEAGTVSGDPVQVRPKMYPNPVGDGAQIMHPGVSTVEAPRQAKMEVEVRGGAVEKEELAEKEEPADKPEKEEHGKEHEGESASAGGEGESSGVILAAMLFMGVIVSALTFMMIQSSNACVSKYTWMTLDGVVAIFLAVLWFQAVDDLVVDSGIFPKSHTVVVLAVYSCFLLLMVIGLSHILKGRPMDVVVFCACAAHFVSFASMHGAIEFLHHHASATTFHCFLGVLAVLIGFVITSVISFFVKRSLGILKDEDLLEKVDDVETDFGAMAVGVVWTMFVVFVISGSLHEVEDPEENPNADERQAMLIYGIGLLVASAGIFAMLSKIENSSKYVVQRLRDFVTSLMAISVAWAFLFWAKSVIRSRQNDGVELRSHLRAAFAISLVALLTIWGLSRLPDSAASGQLLKREVKLVISTLGLMVGWSWEECFDEAVEATADRITDVGTGWLKLALAMSLGAVVLPAYVWYIKPTTVKLCEEKQDNE